MNDATISPARRPKLLTVLCILSFVYGALILVNGYITAFTDLPSRNVEASKEKNRLLIEEMDPKSRAMNTGVDLMETTIALNERVVEHAKPLGYSWLALSVLTITGVWLMWRLQRMGFWLYMLAAIGGVAVKFIYLGGHSLLGSVNSIMGAIFAITFLVLYAVHLKYMR